MNIVSDNDNEGNKNPTNLPNWKEEKKTIMFSVSWGAQRMTNIADLRRRKLCSHEVSPQTKVCSEKNLTTFVFVHFTTISGHFFANPFNIFHKTEALLIQND